MEYIVHRTVRGAPSERWVLFVLKTLVRHLPVRLRHRARSCAVVFVGDARMRTLNKLHRGIDRPTDVLAFPLDDAKHNDSIGDVIIAVPYVRRQAKRFGVSFKEECARILIHGALHLMGYDHARTRGARQMSALQEAAVKDILS